MNKEQQYDLDFIYQLKQFSGAVQSQRWWGLARRIPLLLCMGVIFWFSDQPKEQIMDFGTWDLLVKKGAHMVGYGGLAVAAHLATGRLGVAWLIALLYAISDEYHQTFVPGRNGTAVDVVIDAVGATVALWGLWWAKRRVG